MEVHHHRHSARQKWTHYLWEFLMLFLAVTLGFLVENQREHYIEGQRAKAYAKSLLNDLQADTAEINAAITSESATSIMIDSFVTFIARPDIYGQGEELYYLMRRAGNFYGVDWSKATMNQLINSGNLRYFNNHKLVALISGYNTMASTISEQEDGVKYHRNRATVFRDRVFKAEFYLKSIRELNFDSLNTSARLSIANSEQRVDWRVMNRDPELINSYANALIGTKAYRRRMQDQYYPAAVAEATRIMELLKKEYKLK